MKQKYSYMCFLATGILRVHKFEIIATELKGVNYKKHQSGKLLRLDYDRKVTTLLMPVLVY